MYEVFYIPADMRSNMDGHIISYSVREYYNCTVLCSDFQECAV